MAFENGQRVGTFSATDLDSLVAEAAGSPRRRQHRNLHASYTDACQRFFNAIEPDSYIRPHRHAAPSGPESLFAVRGRMALIVFDDSGEIVEKVTFGSGVNAADAFGVEIPSGCWHTVVALNSGSVLLEVKAGPFNPAQAKDFAPWAPEENSVEAHGYIQALRSAAGA